MPCAAPSGLEQLRGPAAAARLGVDEDVLAALVGRFGGETPALLELAAGRPELLQPLVPGLPHLRAEALWAVRQEMAMTVDDVLARRTRSLLRRALAAAQAAPGIAESLASEWERPSADVAQDAAAFADRARRDLARAGLDPVSTGPMSPNPMPGAPTPVTPIDAPPAEVTDRIPGPRVPVDDRLLERLRAVCAQVTLDHGARAEAGRDWWPLAIRWAARGAVPARPAVVARPEDAEQVSAVLAACHDARVPVTAVAGRSGVCGSSVPVFGGVSLDLCALSGIVDVDTTSLVGEVPPAPSAPTSRPS